MEHDIIDTSITSSHHFSSIHSFFPFSNNEWAKIIGVPRGTIYDWIFKRSAPSGDSIKRIETIYEIVKSCSSNEKEGISRRYLYHTLSRYNMSLLEIFTSHLDMLSDYNTLTRTINELLDESKIERYRLNKLNSTHTQKEHILDYNLTHLHL